MYELGISANSIKAEDFYSEVIRIINYNDYQELFDENTRLSEELSKANSEILRLKTELALEPIRVRIAEIAKKKEDGVYRQNERQSKNKK